MITGEELQSELKRKGISQRDLVTRSGLSESVVSTLIKNMPILLPHLIKALGQNPYAGEPASEGKEMAETLEKLAFSRKNPTRQDAGEWERCIRKDRPLPGRGTLDSD